MDRKDAIYRVSKKNKQPLPLSKKIIIVKKLDSLADYGNRVTDL
jgi:hypothetical protein